MWHAHMEATWDQLAWLAVATRNIHLKKPQTPREINPWGPKKPPERQPFNLGSIDLLAAAMRSGS